MAKMSDTTLKSICEAHMNNALGWVGGLLSKQRTLATGYYRGDAFGNEQDGRSQVVSRDVAEAVDGIMPSLMKVFASTDTIISCSPRKPDAEKAAEQATDYLNYVFQSQPNAFDILQTWIKDGLLQKLGVVKSWWEESEEKTTEQYKGLTRFQFMTLLSDPDVEVQEVEVSDAAGNLLDPGKVMDDLSQQMNAKVSGQGPPQANPGALPQTPENFPGQPPQQQQGAPQAQQTPPLGQMQAMLDGGEQFDVKLIRTDKTGSICIEPIPPEEFLTDRRAVSLDLSHCRFACHRSIRTVTDLLEMGFEKKIVDTLTGGTELDYNTEVITRFKSEDESPQRDDTDSLDPAMRHVWVAECYLKVDYNGDGIAEWRKVTLAGSGGFTILANEDADGHPFSAWTPIKEPHKLYGESLADKTMDIQLIKSTIWRQTLDGMYFNNAPQLIVQEGQANMEDVLTRRPGGVIRVRSQGAVAPLPVQDMSQSGMAMMSYLDSVREARTGVRRWSPGLEGNELNPLATTATGVNSVDDSSQDTMELLARNFAEQGLKHLFKRVLELTCKYQDKPRTIRLRGDWVDIDPSTWDSQMDMSVMVGLGTGDKDKQSAKLGNIFQLITTQVAAAQGGMSGPMVTWDNVYAQANKIVEAAGFKAADNLFTNPKDAPPPPPQPDPNMAKVQGQLQLQAQKNQMDLQHQQAKAQVEASIEHEKMQRQAATEAAQAQADAVTAQHDAILKARLEQMRFEHEAMLDAMKTKHEMQLKQLETSAKIHQQRLVAAATFASKRQVQKAKMSTPKNK